MYLRIDTTESEKDIVQVVTRYISDAGRFTDDAVPPIFFSNRCFVSLKNSKISGEYLVGYAYYYVNL